MENKHITKEWEEDITLIKKRIDGMTDAQSHIAFYGSSSIRLWEHMDYDLYPYKTVNMGFGGSTYKDCGRHFAQLFSHFTPSSIILYCGDNDIALGESPESLLRDINQLTTQIINRYPGLPLALMSIKPSPARQVYLKDVICTNRLIEQHARQIKSQFIDIFTPMLTPAGEPNETLFLADQLHLNTTGYRLWASAIRHCIDNQMNI